MRIAYGVTVDDDSASESDDPFNSCDHTLAAADWRVITLLYYYYYKFKNKVGIQAIKSSETREEQW